MKNTIAILGIATLAAAGVPQLQAGHVSFSIGANIGLPAPVCSAPVCARPPVFVPTAPYACAAPVAPPGWVCVPQQMVVYAPPVYAPPPPPVYYARAPYHVVPGFGINFRFGQVYHPHWR